RWFQFLRDAIAEDKVTVKIPPKRVAMTSLRSKHNHVTLRANEKRLLSLLCRIRKYARSTHELALPATEVSNACNHYTPALYVFELDETCSDKSVT
ncbi:hypothetical protein AVEN_160652-1, partial [Araneus ventricosus]